MKLDDIPITEAPFPETAKTTDVSVTFPQVAGLPAHLVGPVRWDHPCSAGTYVADADRGIVRTLDGRRRTKVCLVGYAENSRHLAWYDDPDCEIWGVNQLYRFIPRADRWFQIHRDWNDPKKWAAGTDLGQWLKTECKIPVYMCERLPGIEHSVAYPLDRVKQALGLQEVDGEGKVLADHDYFTSTIAFMLALAIAEGFEQIGIYGIDLIIGREYFFEKACVEFYMGIAHARGIQIHRPENSALLWQSHRYGYQPGPDYGFYGLAKLEARLKQLTTQVQRLRDEVYTWQGRIDEAQWVMDRLGEPAKGQYAERLAQLRSALDKKLNELFLHDGAKQEVDRMQTILEIKSRGGEVE